MPLPEPNTTWPPPALAPALERMRTWDAWWSGDTDDLARVYGQPRGGLEARPAQYAGGIVGTVARMWWGRPPTPGEPATKLHVPLASDICRASADLLFSEPITAAADDTTTTDALDEFLGDGTIARLLEAAETAAGLGGVYLRVAHDGKHFPDAWIDAIAPDAAYPEWIGGRMVAVTLWWAVEVQGDAKRDDATVWRHLERHERGVVYHGLYRGTADNLGRAMALTDHPATAGLAEHVGPESQIETGYPDGLDVVYVPNMRPQRRWRKSPTLSPLGRPDLDGIEGTLDALDETYSSWLRDIRLAKGRVVVPETYLDHGGPGRGATFDAEREVYSAISAGATVGGGANGPGLTVVQFAIRVEEHDRTSQALVATALRTAGYSAQTFGEADAAAATATEVVARERRSYITRGRKVQYIRPELIELLTAWLAIRAHALGQPALDPTGLTVAFPDAVAEDQAALAQTTALLAGAKSASTETRVRMLWPEADDVWVRAEVARILDEDGSKIELPGFGGPPADEDDSEDAPDDESGASENESDAEPAEDTPDPATGRRRARTSA